MVARQRTEARDRRRVTLHYQSDTHRERKLRLGPETKTDACLQPDRLVLGNAGIRGCWRVRPVNQNNSELPEVNVVLSGI